MGELPVEIQDHIIYLAGLNTAIKLDNKYVINKIINELKISACDDIEELHDNIFTFYTGNEIEYLYKNDFLNKLVISKMATMRTPYSIIYYLSFGVENNDLKKLEIIDSLFPKSVINVNSKKHALSHGYSDVVSWININRPSTFGDLLTKKQCLYKYISKNDLKSMPADVQEYYSKMECGCKKCWKSGIGYYD
jgi:hypothetical protein